MRPDFPQFVPLLFAALLMFAVYRRLRRSFGRQPLRPRAMTFRIVLLAVIGCLLLPLALRSMQYLAADLIGAMLGVGLGWWGSQRTRFLRDAGQLFYVPHTYTGIAVSLLFLGRLVYRVLQAYGTHTDPSQALAAPTMVRSPLTVGFFFVLLGYYIYFYSWVLWKSKHLDASNIEAASPAAAQ
jgi:hypothetical protein